MANLFSIIFEEMRRAKGRRMANRDYKHAVERCEAEDIKRYWPKRFRYEAEKVFQSDDPVIGGYSCRMAEFGAKDCKSGRFIEQATYLPGYFYWGWHQQFALMTNDQGFINEYLLRQFLKTAQSDADKLHAIKLYSAIVGKIQGFLDSCEIKELYESIEGAEQG